MTPFKHKPHFFNYRHAAMLLLPPLLRKPKTLAWLDCLLSPMKEQEEERAEFQRRMLKKFGLHSTVIGMEKQLTTLKYFENDRVVISHRSDSPGVCFVRIPPQLSYDYDKRRIAEAIRGHAGSWVQVEFEVG